MKMFSSVLAGFACLGLVGSVIGETPAATPGATLVVHTDRPGVRVSPTLYGIFFEEINHSGEGGLYAELIRNRTFKEASDNGPAGWTLKADGYDATLSTDDSVPLNSANPKAARIDIKARPGPQDHLPGVSLINSGYWGINLRKGVKYHLSFYARCSGDFHGPLDVELISHQGWQEGQIKIDGPTGEWKKYTGTFNVEADEPNATLAIGTGSTGTLWLNVVSLFPEDTYKNRPNGLRKDLAEIVEAMHPAFMRFPGGCYVEGGDYTANAFRWKNTIGDIAQRPGHANATWGYWSTDGLGYHEYLQFCEDIHAAPLFVCNAGIAHLETLPMDAMPEFVQSAVDAIEYANGPVDSAWGALRAKNGHPQSFHLKYVEIGNENGLWNGRGGTRSAYNQRYKLIYDAIKARYPEIQCISNTRIQSPADLVDDHVYAGPGWFWGNIHQYDKTPRGVKPDVYVGEYADTNDCGQGNLRAALAEAAYMTGFERNSEVVRMSSYAPMFVETNDRKWNPDAIVFDSSRAFGTPSYWVQKLYADNRPDEVIPMDVDMPEPANQPVSKGTIGLGTWNTQAQYKDITVTVAGKTVYSSEGSAGEKTGAGVWKPQTGDWKNQNGIITQTAAGADHRMLLDLPALSGAADYTITLKARKISGDEGFLIMFHTLDTNTFYWWNIGGWGNTNTGIERSIAGDHSEIGPRLVNHVETNRWYDLKLQTDGPNIRCYVDGKLTLDAKDMLPPRFTAIAGKSDADGTLILKVINGSNDDVSSSLKFDCNLAAIGKAITLASSSDADENTFEEPLKISPKTTAMTHAASKFSYIFPARSLTILRLKRD
jgi:alpha-L-arabinofuranosidase